jgi:hypothetical protein
MNLRQRARHFLRWRRRQREGDADMSWSPLCDGNLPVDIYARMTSERPRFSRGSGGVHRFTNTLSDFHERDDT